MECCRAHRATWESIWRVACARWLGGKRRLGDKRKVFAAALVSAIACAAAFRRWGRQGIASCDRWRHAAGSGPRGKEVGVARPKAEEGRVRPAASFVQSDLSGGQRDCSPSEAALDCPPSLGGEGSAQSALGLARPGDHMRTRPGHVVFLSALRSGASEDAEAQSELLGSSACSSSGGRSAALGGVLISILFTGYDP